MTFKVAQDYLVSSPAVGLSMRETEDLAGSRWYGGSAGGQGSNAGEATDALTQVTSAVGRWRAVAAKHGLQQADIDAMEPAFEHAEHKRAKALAGNDPVTPN